ncbi:MAG: 1-deoxy-D-xylulose-5-phosphate reductoisomerase [Desulfovibrionaceae bacterium]|nr:1-deoxy-D-xylulose-5-phosphate reductoisomerase [Desulfovibrionaceae bacterium]
MTIERPEQPRPRLRYISALPGRAWQEQRPRTLSILGSTGSIGRSALEVLRLQGGRFHLAALAGARNIPLLARQAAEFRPDHLGVLEESSIAELRSLLPVGYTPAIVAGQQGFETLATLPGVSTVLSAQVGAAGLRATFAAVRAGKVIALANKESLVLAGDLIRAACSESGACILPVDSEHNAIFQCLAGGFAQDAGVSRLILTASGGPFFGQSRDALRTVGPDQALAHPNWNMGAKITIDSATLMNKGLEIIEARHLYGLPLSAIEVLVHQESIIHSLVEYTDGSQLAQLGQPDMRVPIAYCLGWPDRLQTGVSRLDLAALGSLSFARPDEQTFPCLGLARQAQEAGRGCPVVLNAANEEAVAAFLERRIGFYGIADVVAEALEAHTQTHEPASVDAILDLDRETRARVRSVIDAQRN